MKTSKTIICASTYKSIVFNSILFIFIIIFLLPFNVYASDDDDDYDPTHDYTIDIMNEVGAMYSDHGAIDQATAYQGFINRVLDPTFHTSDGNYWFDNDFYSMVEASEAFIQYRNFIGTTKEDYYAFKTIAYARQLVESNDSFRKSFENYIVNSAGYKVFTVLPRSYIYLFMFDSNEQMSLAYNHIDDWSTLNFVGRSGGSAVVMPNLADLYFVADLNRMQDAYDWFSSYGVPVNDRWGSIPVFYNQLLQRNDTMKYSITTRLDESSSLSVNPPYVGYLSQSNWGWFFSDYRYPEMIVFSNIQAVQNFITGQNTIIMSDYLKQLVDKEGVDYQKVYESIRHALQHGDWVTPQDYQKIITETIATELEEIGEELVNQTQILLDIRDALINGGTKDPYLLQIYNYMRQHGADQDTQMARIIELLEQYMSNPPGGTGDVSVDFDGFADIKDMLEVLTTVEVLEFLTDDEMENDAFWESLMALGLEGIADFMGDVAKTRFPLSFIADWQLMIGLIAVEPEPPDFSIPFNFLGHETEFTLDWSWYEKFKPYWFGFWEFTFIAGFLFLTKKVMDMCASLWSD